jgi:hypothetical protein
MTNHTSPGRYVPLAIMIALHLLAAAWCAWTVGLSVYVKQLPFIVLAPLLITYVAVWLAVQPQLWQRMPYAVVAAALLVAWFHASGPMYIYHIAMLFCLPAGLFQFIVVRSFSGIGSLSWKWRLGVRHLLLWTAAIAISLVLTRSTLSDYYWGLKLDEVRNYLRLAAIITTEYFLLSTLLTIMTLRRKLWPWLIPFALLLLPATALLEASLISLAFGYPWFFDWEAIFHPGLQMLVLALTLLAWRHSGLLIADSAELTTSETLDRQV